MMKQRLHICALFIVLALLLSLFTGCSDLLQSGKFRACERVAEQVATGRDYTKEDVISAVGKPDYFENKLKDADYMDVEVTWWRYETTEFSGYPWRLSVTFDPDGKVIRAEFCAAPGG